MPEENANTGVDQGTDAGGQSEELNIEEILFGDMEEENTGVEEQDDAGPTEGAEQEGEGEKEDAQAEERPAQQQQGSEDIKLPDDADKAFAAKWSAKKDELRDEIVKEIESRTQTTQKQQEQGAPKYREPSNEELEKLANDLDASPQLVKLLHQQQQMINKQTEEVRRRDQQARDKEEFNDAQRYVQELKQNNPNVPDWDAQKLHQYRMDHYKKYQTVLPWREAYKMSLADAVMSGDITKQAQQEAIENIQQRDKEASTLKSSSTKRPTIEDISSGQFEDMVERVKAGDFKRS